MKKNIFSKYLFGALALGMMASCSNDLPVDDGKILPNETTTYVRLSLVGEGTTTRADEEYENGTGDESAVKSILLTFFDAGRNYVGQTIINVNENPDAVVVPGEDNSVERFLTIVSPVTLPENINYPKYVVAYVNPTSASGDLAVDKTEDVMRVIRDRSTVSHTGYRTMNNSVYYNEASGYVRFATEVDFAKQFFNTLEEAKEAKDATINITVERVEAKVSLENELGDITVTAPEFPNGNDSEVKYALEFVPEAWFVNATEKRTFLLKNYRNTRVNYLTGNATYPSTDYGMPFANLQEAFKNNNKDGNRWTEVNNQDFLRSFWAIDPTYFVENTTADLYPDVSFDVRYVWGGKTVNPGSDTAPTNIYPLLYRSYTNVLEEWKAGTSTSYAKYKGGQKTHEYILENTMSLNTLNSTDAMASMSSLVIVGSYRIKNLTSNDYVFDGATTTPDKTKSFYVRHDAGNNLSVMLNDNEAIDFFLERGGSALFVQQIDQEGNPVKDTYVPLRAAHVKDGRYGVAYSDFSLVYPKATITNGVKLSEQWRTLSVKANGKIFIYDAAMNDGAGGYKQATQADLDARAATLYSTYGVVEKFQGGKAYFNIPIKHIWGASKTGKFEAKNVVLGDYGVVRNHHYSFFINKITGLGVGIGEIEQPIVPPTENDQYYISARLNILKWRLVKQNVDL